MDLDIEQIHDVLTVSNLPSSIQDLKNPTEEFVVNLINAFLGRFHIDVNTIVQPTKEQEEVMLYYEDSNVIDLINLHVAMVQICDRIFIDLCITDITSPSSKKVRKQAKFLANFILYVNNKESEIECQVNEIQGRVKSLDDMLQKKERVLEARNEKILHRTKCLSLKEKLIAEVQKVRNEIEKNNKKHELLKSSMYDAEKTKQEKIECLGTLKARNVELTRSIAELQSQIITSPEEYKELLNKLEEDQNARVKERGMMQEAWQDKKHLIEQQENKLHFIQEKVKNLFEVGETYDRLKKISIQEDATKKQIDVLKTDVTNFQKRLKTKKNQCNKHEIDEVHAECEKRLSPLRVTHDQLSGENILHKKKLKEVQIQLEEYHLKLNAVKNVVMEVEEETSMFIKSCQELYNDEISNEKDIREQITRI